MRKSLAVLLAFVLVFSTSTGAFAQGQVNVRHYDVSGLTPYPEDGRSETDWKKSLELSVQDEVIKSGEHGTDNWTIADDYDAFLSGDTSNTVANTQEIFGYITPDEAVEKFRISVDDGIRLYIDKNFNQSFDDNELYLESWKTQGSKTYESNIINLESNNSYKFQIDYFNWGGKGNLKFEAKVEDGWKIVPAPWFSIDEVKNESPIITLKGDNLLQLTVGDAFDEPGYTAADNEDGDITDEVVVGGDQVNSSKAGTYTITYTVEDSQGATDTKNRVVNVIEAVENNNLFITVDDYYNIWFNGEHIGNGLVKSGSDLGTGDGDKNWKTVDEYEVTLANKNLIAVKGWDRSNGSATISGLIAKLEDTSDEITNGNWMYTLEKPTIDDAGREWYELDYTGGNWLPVEVIPNQHYQDHWTAVSDYSLVDDAKWIWSPNFDGSQFDSPVWFRSIVNQNNTPIANDDTVTTQEDTAKAISVLVNDTNAEGGTVTITESPSKGSVSVDSGVITYIPTTNTSGIDTLKYTVTTSDGTSNEATVEIAVEEVDDAAELSDDAATTTEETSVTVTVLANDQDVDSTLDVTSVTQPTNGTVVLNTDDTVTYTPNTDFDGTDTFTYTANGETATVTITVNPVGDKPVGDTPVANDDTVTTQEDTAKAISVLLNDTNAVGGTVTITESPSKGSVSVDSGVITYIPTTNTSGIDTLKYTVTTSDGTSNEATVTVNVLIDEEKDDNDDNTGGGNTSGGGGGFTPSNNDSINAVTDNLTTILNQPVVIDVDELLANDEEADEIISVENGANGTVSINGDEITFTPTEGFIGRAYFYYTAENDDDESDRGTVIVTVEEGTTIEPNETPLGDGNEDEMILINPELVPLGTIDFSDPYIYGYPDDTFRPERPVTRAEIATIVARILKLDLMNSGEAIYNDVHSDDWFYNYIQSASHLEIFNGYADGTFKANQPVTHGEMAAIFSKYWELKNIELPSEEVPYNDVEGHWAEEHISRFYNAGVSVGFIDDTFRPNAFTKRTELVVMVNRIINRRNLEQETPSFIDVSKEFWGYEAIEAATEGFVPLEQ